MTVEHGYVSFGANLGDRAKIFQESLVAIAASGIEVLRTSQLYETAPWGGVEGGPFFNAVLEVPRTGDPELVLKKLQTVEEKFGRQRPAHNAARTCDLDILLWGGLVYSSATLTIPHPRFHLRKFSLVPLCELLPDALHPILQRTFSELLTACTDSLEVSRYPEVSPRP